MEPTKVVSIVATTRIQGAGTEHSSVRLERFLQLCGELNIVVTNITSPANFFHTQCAAS